MGETGNEAPGLREAGDHPPGRVIAHLPVRQTLARLGILPGTFCRWYDRFRSRGPGALEDRSPQPRQVWNRIPDHVREQVLQLALDEPKLSRRELAARFTDARKYFVSEASVYRLLKAHDLIASPAFIVIEPMRSRTRRRRPTSCGRPT
jgi:putative transposase